MTQTPPDDTLLAASIEYLETQLLPALADEHRFKTRLVVNALKILARHQPAAEGSPPTQAEADQAAGRLALNIRSGNLPLDDAKLLASIEAHLRQSLSVNNPKWLS